MDRKKTEQNNVKFTPVTVTSYIPGGHLEWEVTWEVNVKTLITKLVILMHARRSLVSCFLVGCWRNEHLILIWISTCSCLGLNSWLIKFLANRIKRNKKHPQITPPLTASKIKIKPAWPKFSNIFIFIISYYSTLIVSWYQ